MYNKRMIIVVIIIILIFCIFTFFYQNCAKLNSRNYYVLNIPTLDSCSSIISVGLKYFCQPTHIDKNENNSLEWTWKIADTNTCEWLTIKENDNFISGTPQASDTGECNLVINNDNISNSKVLSKTIKVVEVTKLTLENPSKDAFLGIKMALYNNMAVFSKGPSFNNNADLLRDYDNYVYVYQEKKIGVWEQVQNLIPEGIDPSIEKLDFAEVYVDIFEDLIAIGFPYIGTDLRGTVCLYQYNNINSSWEPLINLKNNPPFVHGNTFGKSIKIYGNFMYISTSAKVLIYQNKGESGWEKITETIESPPQSKQFGHSFALSLMNLFVTSPYGNTDESSESKGVIYIFERNVHKGIWELQKKLTNNNPGKYLGYYIDVYENIAITSTKFISTNQDASSPYPTIGGVYIISSDNNGEWRLNELNFENENLSDISSVKVALLNETTAIVSLSGWLDANNVRKGKFCIFKLINNNWVKYDDIVNPESNDYFGASIAVSENKILVSAPSYDNHSGAVYVYYYK